MFIFCLGKIRWPHLYQTRNGRFDLLVLLFYEDHFHIYWATYLLIYSVFALFFCFVLFFICYFFVFVFLKGLVLFSVRGELRSVQDLKQSSVIAAYRDKNNTLLSEYICNAVTAKKYWNWGILRKWSESWSQTRDKPNKEPLGSYFRKDPPRDFTY